MPQYLPYDEQHPTTPISPYSASKLAVERYACSYGEVYDFPVVALRYFTVYGPRMRPNIAISNFVSRCMNDEPPIIYGDGTQTRDFTYIEDIVEATDNIAIKTLAEEIRDQLAPDIELVYEERHDTEHTHADTSKASDLLGYGATHTIREGVSEFVEWYRANREWYEPLVRE